MIRYLLFLWLVWLSTVDCGAQDRPAIYQAGESHSKRAMMDSINRVLLRIYLIQNDNPDSAMAILNGLYKASVQIGYYEGMSAASAEMGGTFMAKGDYAKAEKYILYSQLLPGSNEYFTTNADNNLYLIYSARGNYDLALLYLKRAMRSKDKNVANVAYNNHIAFLSRLGRYKESLYYIGILKKRALIFNQHRILAATISNESSLYGSLKNYKMFDSLARECMKLCEVYHFDDIATICRINFGESYLNRGAVAKAERQLSKIEGEVAKLFPDDQVEYYQIYGEVLYKTGAYAAAISRLNKGIQLARQVGIRDNVKILHYLAKSYQALGDHERAGALLEDYIQVKDSFLNIEIQKNINEHEVKFRMAEKDKELLSRKLVILNQTSKISSRNNLILLTAAGLVILLILFFAYHKYTRQNLLVLERDLDLNEQRSKVGFLKAMIQGEEKERKRIGVALHNGVGSQLTAINLNLTAFQWKNRQIPEVDRLNEIITQVQQTAVEVRKTAHNLLPASIVEIGLYAAIREFTQQFRGSTVAFNVSQSGDLDSINKSLALLVYRVIQELINNVIKHAAATSVDIDLKLDNDVLFATIADNGKGFEVSGVTGKGVGLQQIQQQIDLLKGIFEIHARPGAGTTIYFELDLKYIKDYEALWI